MEGGQSLQIQDPADEDGLLANAMEPASTETPQTVTVLCFAEEIFDFLASALREFVRQTTDALTDPSVSGTSGSRRCRDVRLDLSLQQRLDEYLLEEPLVRSERLGDPAQPASHA